MSSTIIELWRAMNDRNNAGRARMLKILQAGHNVNEIWDIDQIREQLFGGGCVPVRTTEDEGTVCVTPLFFAVLDNQQDLVKILLQYGASTELRARNGTTVLHQAVRYRNKNLIQILLCHGADLEATISCTPNSGLTPLGLAVANSDLEMMEFLLERQSNVHSVSSLGWSAFDVALLNRQSQVLHFLMKYHPDGNLIPKEILSRSNLPALKIRNEQELARHLILHGIEGATQELRRFYLDCFSKVYRRVKGSQDKAISDLADVLVNAMDQALSMKADCAQDVIWDRKLCERCSAFQRQECQSLLQIYLHHPDFEALLQSAEGGCSLCEILVEALETGELLHISRNHGSIYGHPDVRLAIERLVDENIVSSRMKLLIGCGWRASVLYLKQTNEHLSFAISTTSPSDREGIHSERSLMMAKSWFDRCQSLHIKCRDEHLPPLPTRIIDVGSELADPFLYCSTGDKARYAALSCSWVDSQSMATKEANIEQFKSSIDIKLLPKTVRDAIIIARKMQIQYLWVNSFCIIQDSRNDVAQEVPKIGEIFANAHFRIEAKSYANENVDCLRNRAWTSSRALPLDIRLSGGTSWPCRTSHLNRLMLITGKEQTKSSDSVSTQDLCGLALQETLLSRRTLQCRDNELRWICLEETWSDIDLDQNRGLSSHWHNTLKPTLLSTATDNRTPEKRDDVFRQWQRLVQDFSAQELPRPKDKLLALLAIQKRIAPLLDDSPLAGGWRDHYFWPSLLWHCKPEVTKGAGMPFICPSWSWASVKDAITYDGYYSNTSNILPYLESINLDTSLEHYQLRGSITVKGSLIRHGDLPTKHSVISCLNLKHRTERIFPFATDTQHPWASIKYSMDPDVDTDENEIWYLLVASNPFAPTPRGQMTPTWRYGRPATVVLIILQKLSDTLPHFRRIGLAEVWDKRGWRRRCRRETIKIF